MLNILHTGDNHLGASFLQLGKKAKEHRRYLERTFQRIIDRAIHDNVDIILIAGDLFDSNTPPQSAIDTVHYGIRQLEKKHIYVAILPGTHDYLCPESIYRKERFEQQYTNTHVFNDSTQTSIHIPELNLTLHGNALTQNKSTFHPLRELKKNSKSQYNIALAHGSVAIPGKHAKDDWPITLEEIRDSEMDYIALAHWHTKGEYSSGSTRAWYCGSPEALKADEEGVGHVLQISLNPRPVVTPITIGTRAVIHKVVPITLQTTTNELLLQIQNTIPQSRDKQILAFVELTGIRSHELHIDTEKLEEALEEYCAYIAIKDNTSISIDDNALANTLPGSTLHYYIENMKRKIKDAKTNEERQQLQEALQIGVAELQGKRII